MTELVGPGAPGPRSARRRTLLLGGVVAVVAGLTIGLVVVASGGGALAVDVWWAQVMAGARTGVGDAVAHALNAVGGGWFGVYVVPIGGAVALLLMRRPWAAAFFLTVSIVDVVLVQLLKRLFLRDRPEDMLVTSDIGSFPSGHVANAAAIAVALAVIAARRWVTVVGIVYVLLMVLSRAYLSVHWLSDTIAGAFIGGGIALLVALWFVSRLDAETLDTPAVGRTRGETTPIVP